MTIVIFSYIEVSGFSVSWSILISARKGNIINTRMKISRKCENTYRQISKQDFFIEKEYREYR